MKIRPNAVEGYEKGFFVSSELLHGYSFLHAMPLLPTDWALLTAALLSIKIVYFLIMAKIIKVRLVNVLKTLHIANIVILVILAGTIAHFDFETGGRRNWTNAAPIFIMCGLIFGACEYVLMIIAEVIRQTRLQSKILIKQPYS